MTDSFEENGDFELPGGISPEILAAVEIKSASLDESDYFQILEVPMEADQRQIKDAYRALAKCFHPDSFRNFPVPEFQSAANKLFKRINEAFFVLRDDAKRSQYLIDIMGPNRADKLRYTEQSESQQKAMKRRSLLEQDGQTPHGRECYRMAMKEIEGHRWSNALRQLKMALMYEPQNEVFKERLVEVESAIQKGTQG